MNPVRLKPRELSQARRDRMRPEGRPRLGFTLAEVLAATTIGAFVALVAVGSLRTVSRSAAAVQDRSDRAGDLRFAARRMAEDLANVVRDQDPNQSRLIGGVENSGFGDQSYLMFWTFSHGKVRDGQPEGDVYEVEYHVAQKDDRAVLMRRVWPNPTRDVEAGGVLGALSEEASLLKVLFFDGEKWVSEWPQTMQRLPLLVEVRLFGRAEEGQVPAQESFLATVTGTTAAQAADLSGIDSSQDGTESAATGGQDTGQTPVNE